jgi:nitrate/nitrite transport system substrate-binding protein
LRIGRDRSVMKFDEKYGIKIVPSKEASWAAVRDKLVKRRARRGARAVRPHLWRPDRHRRPEEGHGGAHELNHNGQAITLSNR